MSDVSVIGSGRWGLSRPLFVDGGWTTYAMEQRLASRSFNYFPPRAGDGTPLCNAVLVRLQNVSAAPSDGNTILFPRDLADLGDVTLGELTAAQRNTLRNTLESWLTGYTFTDWDGTLRTIPPFSAVVLTYTNATTLKQVARDIYRHFAHTTVRSRLSNPETHNTEYTDDFSTDPSSRWTTQPGCVTGSWNSGAGEYTFDGDNNVGRVYSANNAGSIEHEAQITSTVSSVGSRGCGAGVRMRSGTHDAYGCSVNNANNYQLWKYVGGTRSTLADAATGGSFAAGDWITLRLAAGGGNGANVELALWWNDHGATKPGDPGWHGVDGSPNATYTDTAADRLDDDTLHLAQGVSCRGNVSGNSASDFFKLRAISDRGGGGTTYFSTVAGTMTTAGALLKHSATAKAGTLTTAGALLKRTAKAFTGTLTTAGTLAAIKTVLLSLAGTLTTAGVLVKQTGKPLASALTTAGALLKQTAKAFTGTLTTAGVLTSIKTILKDLGTATLSTAGAVVRQTRRSVTGTMTTAGALVKQTAKAFSGALTTAGTLAAIRTVLLALTAVLSTAGALTKRTSTSLTGTLATAGAVVKRTAKEFTATLTAAGALAASIVGALPLVRTLLATLRVSVRPSRDLDASSRVNRDGEV